MKIYARRLTEGMDLKKEIEKIVEEEAIRSGIILSSVGCVGRGRLRLADGKSIKEMTEPLEILNLNGTLSPGGLHLHISFGDDEGRVWGGHLVEGNIINTTCELIVGIMEGYRFHRAYDEGTGYKELKIEK